MGPRSPGYPIAGAWPHCDWWPALGVPKGKPCKWENPLLEGAPEPKGRDVAWGGEHRLTPAPSHVWPVPILSIAFIADAAFNT